MKKHLYLLLISFSLLSCYTYRPRAEKDATQQDTKKEQANSEELAARAIADPQANLTAVESKSPKGNRINKVKNQASRPTDIKEILEINKYFKIEAGGKPYKIQVDKWESDTLVAHVIHKPKKILKFHKNQINQSTIAERRFSQPTADIITVLAYAGIGVLIWSLVR